jgi:hypothetical protein
MRYVVQSVFVVRSARARGRVRLLGALALACLLPVAAAGYTIVMRGGRRIEAPANFVLTQTTLTYEAAPGLNVTLPLAEIDIAATERANNEPAGSLLRRAQQPKRIAPQPAPAPHATRTLTNRELEPVRRARLESERAYDVRRKELGLPPPVNEQRSAEAEARALREIARTHEAAQAQAESYWRARAASLREEMAALDGEIDYLRTELMTRGYDFVPGSAYVVTRVGPFVSAPLFGFGRGARFGGRFTFGGATRGRIFFNGQHTRGGFRRRFFGRPGLFVSPFVGVAIPFDYATADDATLQSRLIDIETERAALDARWQELEDEAQREGAQPGWLRP